MGQTAPKRLRRFPLTRTPIPYLPAELLDHIVDHLHDSQDALRNCCLVSISWIPRTRRHLFADIKLTGKKNLNSWKHLFPDPSTSPARYAQTLYIKSIEVITAASEEPTGWIRGFSSIVHLKVDLPFLLPQGSMFTLVPFYGLSPALKSLHITFTLLQSSQLFDLIHSFPLLEDLGVITYFNVWTDDGGGSIETLTMAQPQSLPKLTGSLELLMCPGIKPIAHRLLSLPGGVHFRKLTFTWYRDEDLSPAIAMVNECSSTLESLEIESQHLVEQGSALVDLTKVRKLKEVALRCKRSHPLWVILALRTITPDHRNLQWVSIQAPYINSAPNSPINRADPANVRRVVGRGETTYTQWLELDRLLVQLWEMHSIRLEVLYHEYPDEMGRRCVGTVLPEVTKRGIADLVKWGA